MAYVRMKKGSLYANVFDSPEMIASAKSDGYVIVTEEEAPVRQAETKVEKTVKADEKPAYKAEEKTEVKTSSRTKRQ